MPLSRRAVLQGLAAAPLALLAPGFARRDHFELTWPAARKGQVAEVTFSVPDIDRLLLEMWDRYSITPDVIIPRGAA